MKPKLNGLFNSQRMTRSTGPRLLITIITLAILAFPLYAQDLMVEYLEGFVEISTDSGWEALYIGDELSADARIRVSENGFAEFSAGAVKIAVSEDGVYAMRDLIGASKEVSSWGLGSLVSGKLKVAIRGGEGGQTAVMGVRGAKSTEELNLEWMEDEEADTLFAQGMGYFKQGLLEEAVEVFKRALELADYEKEDLCRYYIAQSYSDMGKVGLALETLSTANMDPRSSVYTDLVLLNGQLLMESLAFHEALSLFNTHLENYPEGSIAQAFLILSAFCYQGLGDTISVRNSLEQAVDIDPHSELGREAKSMMENL